MKFRRIIGLVLLILTLADLFYFEMLNTFVGIGFSWAVYAILIIVGLFMFFDKKEHWVEG